MGLETVLEQARELEIQGKNQKANDLLTPVIDRLLGNQSEDPLFPDLLNLIGDVKESLGQPHDALDNYLTALRLATKDTQRAEALANQAKIYIVDQGLRDIGRALILLNDTDRYVEERSLTMAKMLEYHGLAYMEQGVVVVAIHALKTASEVATSLILSSENSKYVQHRHAEILYHLGTAYQASDSVYVRRQAPGVAVIARNIFRRLGNPERATEITGTPW